MIGKHLTEQGAVGGAFQKEAESNEQHLTRMTDITRV
jgi:hypothetical protein